MSGTALPNISGAWFTPGSGIMKQGLEASRNSPRQRMILPIHRTQDSAVQRMINFLQPETYIRPHLHPRPGATESICIIQGALLFLIYDPNGAISQSLELTSELHRCIMDIEPGVWHSFVVLEKDTVIFETKAGPYDADRDKTFAEWAPEEDSPEATNWVSEIKRRYHEH